MNCTPFCPTNCKRKHHPILLSLIDTNCKKSFKDFKHCIDAHKISGFDLSNAIHDPDPSFRYPILHWAGVLGKVKVIKLLLKSPYNLNANLRCTRHETVLHRSLLGWSGHINIETMVHLIRTLKMCLNETDIEKQNPFHVCATLLTNCNKKNLSFWKQIFNKMITINENSALKYTLNSKDINGDTVLHILVKRNSLVNEVEYVVCCGGDIQEKNKTGETPIELAWRFSTDIFNLLNMLPVSSKSDECEIRTRVALGLSETKDYTEFFTEGEDADTECSEDEDEIPRRKIRDPGLLESIDSINMSIIDNRAKTERPRKRRRVMFILSDSDEDDDDNNLEVCKILTGHQENGSIINNQTNIKEEGEEEEEEVKYELDEKESLTKSDVAIYNNVNEQLSKPNENPIDSTAATNYVPDPPINPFLSCHPRYRVFSQTNQVDDEKSNCDQQNGGQSQSNPPQLAENSVNLEEHHTDENLIALKDALLGYGIEVDFDNYENNTVDKTNKEIEETLESIREMHLENEINDDEGYQESEENENSYPFEECIEVNQRIQLMENILFNGNAQRNAILESTRTNQTI